MGIAPSSDLSERIEKKNSEAMDLGSKRYRIIFSGSLLFALGYVAFHILSVSEPISSSGESTAPTELAPAATAESPSLVHAEAPLRNTNKVESAQPEGTLDSKTTEADTQVLPKVLWDFRKKAGTVDLVLQNTVLNPLGIRPNEAQRTTLQKVLRDHQVVIADAERLMTEKRTKVIDELLEQGRVTAAAPPEPSGYPMPKSSDPETETGLVIRNGSTYVYNIQWGQDVGYDDMRMRVYTAKDNAIKAIQDLIASFSSATTAK